MPIGKFGEVIGTMDTFGDRPVQYDSKVVAPKNPKLLRDGVPYIKLTPSEYLFQMSLDTRKKLQNTRTMELPAKVELLDMSNTTYQKTSNVSMEDPIFQPFPSSVFFVNCEPNETHELPLILRNNDKVPRLVKVTHEDSPYFRIIAPPNASHKVAAGLPIVFKIQFTPDQRKDYKLNLVVVTEREKFVVPVHCIGARAILDFPDEINFSPTPLKYSETKTLFIRNIGNAEASFTIETNGPFNIEPNAAVIGINESMQMILSFCPEQPMEYSDEIIVHYETGEDVYIKVRGPGQEIPVRLERPQVQIEETYVGLSNLKTITLHNRSDIMVHFYWSNFASQVAEDLDRETFMKVLKLEETEELQKFQTEDDLELLSSDKMTIVNRNYFNKRKMYQEKKSRFTHDIFTIEPIEGDIWPHSSLDITIAFKPAEARTYQSFGFCEITGRETRLSLKMIGIGVGPKVEFSFKTLDMGYIFIHAFHSYELVLKNKGDIDALFKIEGSGSIISRCFSFTPDDGLISPGSHQAVQVNFHSKEFLGEFNEEFRVKMDGCLDPLYIRFRGTVIGPTFNFNLSKLKFGKVSVGFPTTKEIVLHNSSLVPLKYRLRVPSDGFCAPLLADDLDSEVSPRSFCTVYQPKEFEIRPSEDTVNAMSSKTISVTLTSNSVRKYNTELIIDVIGVGDEISSVLMTASAIVPDLELSTDVLDFSRCFLRHPYQKCVTLINSSSLPVMYRILPQTEDTDSLTFNSAVPKAVINGNTEIEIPMQIQALSIGELSTQVKFKIFGLPKDPMTLTIQCIGEGPVVNISQVSLDWGIIKVLEDNERIIRLSNESEISAVFSASVTKYETIFRTEPRAGVLQRHESVDLRVIANLNDSVKFSDELILQVEDSKTRIVPLTATGQGTTITFDPPMPSPFNLGSHFSRSLFQKVFVVTNRGKRHQQLVWSNDGYSYTKALRQSSKQPAQQAPILTVVPHRFDLSPGECAELTIQGSVDHPQVVREKVACHAIIGRQGGKELIKRVDLEINFISPVLEYSEQLLHFRLDKSIHNEFETLRQQFSLRNVSGLALHSILSTSYPFFIADQNSQPKSSLDLFLDEEKELIVTVEFDPLYKRDSYSRRIEDVLKVSFLEHPNIDQISLIGEVNFPNVTFDRTRINFGSVLNNSEVSQFVMMTNHSPLEVRYSWTLLVGGEQPNIIFHRRQSSSPDMVPELPILDATEKDVDTEKNTCTNNLPLVDKLNLDDSLNEQNLDFSLNDTRLLIGGSSFSDDVAIPLDSNRLASQANVVASKRPALNPRLKELLDADKEVVPLGIEEVFDVRPLFGSLRSGEVAQITFTYFGHADVEATVVAVCEVEGGPAYRFELSGEASTVNYELSTLEFDFGQVPFDVPVFRDLLITNTGKVTFEFTSKQASAVLPDNQCPAKVPLLVPVTGTVPAGSSTTVKVGYLPGVPGVFTDSCSIQIAHFGMQTISITGYATFPRITLEIPHDDGLFNEVVMKQFEGAYSCQQLFGLDSPFNELIAVRKKAVETEKKVSIGDADVIRLLEDEAVRNQFVKSDGSFTRILINRNFDRPSLPAYRLDFGNVILGERISKVIETKNTGSFPIHLKMMKAYLMQTGFSLTLNNVKCCPPQKSFNFEIEFDPRAANLELGLVEAFLFIDITAGPIVPVRLTAFVTMPDLTSSSEVIEFDKVKVGQAKLVTIQLYNPTPVVSEWTTTTQEQESATQMLKQNKFLMKNKRKRSQEKKPLVFEFIPASGALRPGQHLNIQVKFMPLEGKNYSQRIVMLLNQSSKRLVIKCTGTGLEPMLEFKDQFIQFGPVLPHTFGCEKSITVKNPCTYPIEFYSLEFDRFYLDDEEVLRHINGYDGFGNILMPPRMAGEKLPQEFQDYWEDHCKRRAEPDVDNGQKERHTEDLSEIEQATNSVDMKKQPPTRRPSKSATSVTDSESTALDDLEQTPVSQAIARYLGIELTPEGKAARRNRGIAIVVIGSPISGKTETASWLADKYSACLLTIDCVVLEALNSSNTPTAQKARTMCLEAARRNEALEIDDGAEKKTAVDASTILGAAAAHAQPQVPHNRKTSTVSTAGRHPSKQSGSKDHPGDKTDANAYMLAASPPPLSGPSPTKLSICETNNGENIALMSCVLPDDVVIQLLSERLLYSDCQKGVVFDGLDSLFTQNQSSSAQFILHALNNRRFLYFVTLKRDFKTIKEEEVEEEEREKALKLKQEEDQWVRIQDMTEEEYDALDEKVKYQIEEKRLRARREKKKKELEENERQRLIQEEMEAEVQRQKEMLKKGAKKVQPAADDKSKPKGGKETSMGKAPRENTVLHKENSAGATDKHLLTERPESHMTEMSTEAEEKKKKARGMEKKSVGKIEEGSKDNTEIIEEMIRDPKKEHEWLLYQKFKTFDVEYKAISEILSLWDRAHPPMKQSHAIAEENNSEDNVPATKRTGRNTVTTKRGKDHLNAHGGQAAISTHSPNQDDTVDGPNEAVSNNEDTPGITNIIIDVSKKSATDRDAAVSDIVDREMPLPADILEGLGLGPKGPPIPPPALFSIVQYPPKRRAPNMPEMFGETGHYNFIGCLEEKDDDKVSKDVIDKDEDKYTERSKDDVISQLSSVKTTRSKKQSTVKDPISVSKSTSKRSVNARRGSQSAASAGSAPTPVSDDGNNDALNTLNQTQSYRWIVQPESEINLRLRFKSDELGQFDQTFNFEILDTRRKYQIFCRGICAFPTISKEPRIVFPNRKRNKEFNEIVHKKFILDEEIFEFGPLLIHKDKQRVLENKFPENIEQITIKNSSPLPAEINFSFLNDAKSERFFLDPPSMLLQSEEAKKLMIWAFPRAVQKFDDAIVCCIKENPEPIIFKLSCSGVAPVLEMDRKILHFDRVLLHRKDMKILYLRNSTTLPLFWQITGLDTLGDEFSFSNDNGVIEPLTEFKLNAYFRSMKPYKSNQKKNIRIEVYDAEKIAGILQTETIQVLAEAYDVALDMSFPKGATNGIDMGVVKVEEEAKQQITLKNRGPYEIKYRFDLDSDKQKYNLDKLFTLTPNQGSLSPGEKALQVLITFCAKDEVFIKDEPILKCNVIEPSVSETGETIAIIPIKISAKCVYSKFVVTPKADINFGAVTVHTKKTRQIIIDNTGEFEFKFLISKAQKAPQPTTSNTAVTASNIANKESGQKESGPPQTIRSKQNENVLLGGSQSRLQIGNFILYPAAGSVQVKGSIIITVDCISDAPGCSDENLIIEITDRDPKIDPRGIPYRLFVEAFVPGIEVSNLSSIFEEHRLCESLSMIHKDIYQICSGGIYGKSENRFLFTNVLVGTKVEARFRLDNPYKVPCEIGLSMKPLNSGRSSVGGRGSASMSDIFEVEPVKAQIEPRSFLYVTVVFSPLSMQQYLAVLECSIEGLPPNSPYKSKALSFEICGEGYLPRISVVKPTLRNKKGQYLCLFKRSLTARTQIREIELYNNGALPCRVLVDLIDPDFVFWLTVGEHKSFEETRQQSSRQPHDLVLTMDVGNTQKISVNFRPKLNGKYCAHVKIRIINNQYEDTIIQLVGEGYEDYITFENLPYVEPALRVVTVPPTTQSSKNAPQPPAEEVIEASKNNLLYFGDCPINQPRSIGFCLTNHSTDTSVRFVWPSTETGPVQVPVKFVPTVGHLHPGQSVSITATISPTQPKSWNEKVVQCKLVKINMLDLEPGQKPLNWDDSKKTMKWVDSVLEGTPNGTPAARKKKVIETEPEPKYAEVTETSRSLDLLVTANSDYCKYKCKISEINFYDTMLFETRTFGFNLKNEGTVTMKYCWQLKLEENDVFTPRSSSRMNSARNRKANTEEICNPFFISPTEGIIAGGDKQNLEVSFSPLDVDFYRATLSCVIENLDPSAAGLVISISGRSLQPHCHFELNESDYLTASRRDPTMRGPGGAPPGSGLNPNTRVIEIFVTGVSSKDSKRFGIINPTKTDFRFQWICEDLPNLKGQSSVQCLITNGMIEAGKKAQSGFQFVSQSVGITESFWRFEVPELGVSVPFLIVGQCAEPNITFEKSHFTFPAILVGHESVNCVDLINFDAQAYSFSFVDVSRHAPGHINSLRIDPMTGTVPANASLPIHIGFTATCSQKLNFNLVCKVEKKTFPLTLNVKAESYSIDGSVWVEDESGHARELVPLPAGADPNSGEGSNIVDFGRIEAGEELTKHIVLVNDGRFQCEYRWDLVDDVRSAVAIDPLKGMVPVGGRSRCLLTVHAVRSMNTRALLAIDYGSTYSIIIKADVRRPIVAFSFDRFDFGHCFVYRAGMRPLSTQLVIQNKDTESSAQRPVSVECLTESTDVLMHNFQPKVLMPGSSVTMEITFLPRKAQRYEETLVFEINGMSRTSVIITGYCEDLRLEAIGLANHTLPLGMARAGETISKTVLVANKNHVAVTAKILFSPTCEELLERGVMKVIPLGTDVTIQPGKNNAVAVHVHFSPKRRISKFTEEVYFDVFGVTVPVFFITGGCQAHDIRLDVESISFGLVTKGSRLVRKCLMNNYGDIGAKFTWNADAFQPDFSISPITGYISPGMEVVFDIVFHPVKPCPDIRYDSLDCSIEGWKSLRLVLTGVCQSVAPVKETLNFSVSVRQQEIKSLKINNNTNATWALKPVIEGEHWSGIETLIVEPQQTKAYDITFKPLLMTQDGKKHQGSVFIALPDGSALLYNLTGIAEPPKAITRINRELPAKTAFTELLEVQNWLKRPQRFKVLKEVTKPEKSDSGAILKGFDYVDVPGNASKMYKFTYTAQREGITQLKITFLNETTGEYQFYELVMKATKPTSTQLIQLTSPVRQSVSHSITLENNLGMPITYQINSTSSEIHCASSFQVLPQSKIPFTFEFFPLRIGDSQGKLEFNSPETGPFFYDFELSGTAPRNEQPLVFSTTIGTTQTLLAHFKNYTKNKADFACKMENSKFYCDKSITVAPSVDAQLEIHFEPGKLGEARGMLTITNSVAGDFVFPLLGTAYLPKPQGPYSIRGGSTLSINFRNVFADAVQFNFQVDNPAFHLNKATENIKSRKEHRIVIAFDGSPDGGPVMGKLIVACPDADGDLSKLQWVYYLRGVQKD